jgi:hypothetical protein
LSEIVAHVVEDNDCREVRKSLKILIGLSEDRARQYGFQAGTVPTNYVKNPEGLLDDISCATEELRGKMHTGITEEERTEALGVLLDIVLLANIGHILVQGDVEGRPRLTLVRSDEDADH